MPETHFRYDEALVSYAECPECHGLVLAYESVFHGVAPSGEEELLKLVCDRCGTVSEMPGDDLLLPPIPVSWLLATPPWRIEFRFRLDGTSVHFWLSPASPMQNSGMEKHSCNT